MLTLDEATHTYHDGERVYTAVSHVIRAMLPAKKSYDGIDPAVIENARERGIRVDRYAAEYVRTGTVTIEPGERTDVLDRVEIFAKAWDREFDGLEAEPQVILADHFRDIAGTVDFLAPDTVIDLKCTWRAEVDWEYQVGAYASMAGASTLKVLHVHPKAISGKYRIVTYTAEAVAKWERMAAFWSDVREMLHA